MERQGHLSGRRCEWLAGALLFVAMAILPASEATAQLRLKTFTVPPCRILDTRLATPPGPIPASTIRTIRVTGNIAAANQGGASDCGIPARANCFVGCNPGTVGVYVNVIAIGTEGDGHLLVSSIGGSSSTLNFSSGQTVANGVLVGLCVSDRFGICGVLGELRVELGPAAAHIVMDVTGYAYLVNPF